MLLRLPTILGFLMLTAHAAECCTIPVFRYALDRWESDRFHLILPASASQDATLQDLLRPLRANGKANLDITNARDGTQTEAVLRDSRGSEKPLWSGLLDKAALEAVLDSPARQKIIQQILAGDSILWVIADSGSPLDAAEVERVEKRLRFLEQVASLPIQDPNDPDSQLGPGPPLRLKFTTLRLRRDDPAEKLFLRMLAGSKGAIDPASTNFAAAVFGRGRVLGAWPLEQLDDRALEEASMFLVGRCSCRMKNENPGWDLLLNVDWEKALNTASSPTIQPSSAAVASPEMKSAPEVVSIAAEAVTEPQKTASFSGVATGGALLGAVLLVFAVLKPRKD